MKKRPFDLSEHKIIITSFWHPIDGEWRRLEQKMKGNKITYVTDGKIEGTWEISHSGTIKP